ncbi:MBL fold metallo-hydrolase [Methanococcoides sp. SA1]|nr:MBL fold metallo-hydrolase [Methanococcoides sp. SA1]
MQITRHVHAIKIPFTLMGNSGERIERSVHSYLIYGRDICLVDCGVAGSENIIFDHIKATGRDPDEISLIVQTHSHADHTGSTPAIKELTGCKVAAHRDAVEWIEHPDIQAKIRPVPGFENISGGPFRVDEILEDGDLIELDDVLSMKVMHTPGHSKGSISLMLLPDNVLFTGDALPLVGDIPIYEDVEQVISSLRRIKDIDNIGTLLSSWDDLVKGEDAYRYIDERIEHIHRIHEAVIEFSSVSWEKVMDEIGLEGVAINPLVLRSFEAHLKTDIELL